ncbi:MAG: hypothetical protein AAGA66_11090 [Bacteroidota bacterium]
MKEIREKINQWKGAPQTSWSQEELWRSIESGLDGESKRRIPFSFLRLAASIVMVLGLLWWFADRNKITLEKEPLTEYRQDDASFSSIDVLSEGKRFITEACLKQLAICTSPSFKVLYAELIQVEEEKIALKEIVNQYGQDEASTKALIQLKNAESSITSELISMISS